MINKIKKEKELYIIVEYRRYKISKKSSQYNKKIVEFVMDNYELINDMGDFRIYYKK